MNSLYAFMSCAKRYLSGILIRLGCYDTGFHSRTLYTSFRRAISPFQNSCTCIALWALLDERYGEKTCVALLIGLFCNPYNMFV